jgi:diketogulonate reductase-like aldo/keto reductase
MPALGLGTLARDALDLVAGAVESAIAVSYRLTDTAASYQSERAVGEGVRRTGINRSELFVTTKLWMTEYGYERTLRAFDSSLRKLGLEYLDLYLLHWPVPSDFETTIDSYRALGKLVAEGRRLRTIGVSNFSPKHLDALIERTGVVLAVNQVELHPFFIQRELRETNSRLGIVTQSW